MNHKKLKGFIAAVHTPVNEDYSLNLDCVQTQANHLVKCGVAGVYVSGTTKLRYKLKNKFPFTPNQRPKHISAMLK